MKEWKVERDRIHRSKTCGKYKEGKSKSETDYVSRKGGLGRGESSLCIRH
jgi:hypothetical protein